MNLSYLFLLFLVLKLTNVIAWSWWWVTAPLWIGPAFVALLIVGSVVFALVIALITAIAAIVSKCC